jgi:hypothetical protein
MNLNKFLIAALLLFACVGVVMCAPKKAEKKPEGIYIASQTNVLQLGRLNFESQITNARQKGVSIVHFYRKNDQGSAEFAPDYESFSGDMKGAFKIGAVDCDEHYDTCEKEKVTKTPLVRVYPPMPIPSYDHEGELSTKAIVNAAARYVGSNVIEINSTNHNKFTTENPSVPKVLLFTDKPSVPLMYKALSLAFEKKIFFGIVRKEQTDLFNEYAIRNTPQLLVIKSTERKPIVYEGPMKYQNLFDFFNVYSEAFVAGGEKLDTSKPWLTENVPELNVKSYNDICFKTEGGFCAIVLNHGVPEPSVFATLEELSKSHKERTNYRYMWLNVDTNTDFANMFGASDLPKLAVFSPGKRKKFLLHEGSLEATSIGRTFDIIENGDARFTHKANVPDFQA